MSDQSVSQDGRPLDYRALRKAIVQMEINDLAAIAAVREHRATVLRLSAAAEVMRAGKRRRRFRLIKGAGER